MGTSADEQGWAASTPDLNGERFRGGAAGGVGRVAPGNGALPGRRPSSLLLCRFSGGECLSRCEWLV